MEEKTLTQIFREAWWEATGPTTLNDWQAEADRLEATDGR
jgi:hypothetical protein